MPRKGTAMVKKTVKYIIIKSDGEEVEEVSDSSIEDIVTHNSRHRKQFALDMSDEENADPAVARDQQKLSNAPPRDGGQPRQETRNVEQSRLANTLFPQSANEDSDTYPADLIAALAQVYPDHDPLSEEHRQTYRKSASNPHSRAPDTDPTRSSANFSRAAGSNRNQRQSAASSTRNSNNKAAPDDPDTMAHQAAFISPNQHRHMRACMVCSIVRTQQQFQISGCPNCEHFLELAGNSEAISECTSQVFEGLISVADTSRSWVARYQRLEGYVTGVYATQVEGILPEDVLAQVEAAGVNYVQRDGSDQDMLGKE